MKESAHRRVRALESPGPNRFYLSSFFFADAEAEADGMADGMPEALAEAVTEADGMADGNADADAGMVGMALGSVEAATGVETEGFAELDDEMLTPPPGFSSHATKATDSMPRTTRREVPRMDVFS